MSMWNPRGIERKVFTSFFQDGSLEAYTGIFLLQLGLPVLFSRSGYGDLQSALITLPIALVLLAVAFLVRRFVVVPRLGRVKFLPERRRKLSRLILVPTAALLAAAIVGYVFAENPSMGHGLIGLLPFSLPPILVFGAAAYFLDMRRLYVYGTIVGFVVPLGKYLETVIVSRDTLPATVLFTACVFFGVATVLFIAFLREYRMARM